mgnify:CR=1 FL=1
MCCTESVRRNLAVLCSSCIAARYQRLSKNSSHGVSLAAPESCPEIGRRNTSAKPQHRSTINIKTQANTTKHTQSWTHNCVRKTVMKTCPTSTDPAARFCYRVRPESVYNSICGRQRNVQTSDSDRGLEIGRARPDRAARIMWHTGTMVC